MHQRISELISYSNRLALQLSARQRAVNEVTLQRQGMLRYSVSNEDCQFSNMSSIESGSNTNEANGHLKGRLSNLAFEMTNIGYRLMSLIQERNKNLRNQDSKEMLLQMNTVLQNEDIFPWQKLKNLDINSKSNRSVLKRIVLQYYKTHLPQIRKVMKELKITEKQLLFWINENQKVEKRQLLAQQITKRTKEGPITLIQFRHIAKQIYNSKMFRPSSQWCLSFLQRYGLNDKVIMNFPDVTRI